MAEKFQQAYEMYKDDQLHNKKIAKYMGQGMDASHMRAHKKRMLKEMRSLEKLEVKSKIKEHEEACGDVDWVQY